MTNVPSISVLLLILAIWLGSKRSPAPARPSSLVISRRTFSYLRACCSSGSDSRGTVLDAVVAVASDATLTVSSNFCSIRLGPNVALRSRPPLAIHSASLLAASALRALASSLRFCGQLVSEWPMRSQWRQRVRRKGRTQWAARWSAAPHRAQATEDGDVAMDAARW
eukprot:CAMPEP_0197880776 /NCGR_PEP_ID=MMETSP1439-20131203/8461_1 /TAXON_ID=66791 /ORGANISM="Gonyaulax spinifera, Strain CCMP409" /LENGTH=166 /DNA_ID=CAMNT_0043500339 /DNA_START=200 /DNA_END=697 /DNA_ORIENTATION=-